MKVNAKSTVFETLSLFEAYGDDGDDEDGGADGEGGGAGDHDAETTSSPTNTVVRQRWQPEKVGQPSHGLGRHRHHHFDIGLPRGESYLCRCRHRYLQERNG